MISSQPGLPRRNVFEPLRLTEIEFEDKHGENSRDIYKSAI
jgi:hypothetical protein